MSAWVSFINQQPASFAQTLNISVLSLGDQVPHFSARKEGRIGKSGPRYCVKRLPPPSLLSKEFSFFIIIIIFGVGSGWATQEGFGNLGKLKSEETNHGCG